MWVGVSGLVGRWAWVRELKVGGRGLKVGGRELVAGPWVVSSGCGCGVVEQQVWNEGRRGEQGWGG